MTEEEMKPAEGPGAPGATAEPATATAEPQAAIPEGGAAAEQRSEGPTSAAAEPAKADGVDVAAKLQQLEVHFAAKDEAFQELEGQYRRLAADFENFRRRQTQERENLVKFAGERVLERFLEVLDNFERALTVGEKATDPQQVLTGVGLIYRQIQDFLAKEGVAPMDAKGSPFDPNQHEAVVQEAVDDVPDQTVLEEFRKGYVLNGRVLRHAMVKIADNPAIPAVAPTPTVSAGEEAGEPASSDSAQQ